VFYSVLEFRKKRRTFTKVGEGNVNFFLKRTRLLASGPEEQRTRLLASGPEEQKAVTHCYLGKPVKTHES
jgi:hypothetical protein